MMWSRMGTDCILTQLRQLYIVGLMGTVSISKEQVLFNTMGCLN